MHESLNTNCLPIDCGSTTKRRQYKDRSEKALWYREPEPLNFATMRVSHCFRRVRRLILEYFAQTHEIVRYERTKRHNGPFFSYRLVCLGWGTSLSNRAKCSRIASWSIIEPTIAVWKCDVWGWFTALISSANKFTKKSEHKEPISIVFTEFHQFRATSFGFRICWTTRKCRQVVEDLLSWYGRVKGSRIVAGTKTFECNLSGYLVRTRLGHHMFDVRSVTSGLLEFLFANVPSSSFTICHTSEQWDVSFVRYFCSVPSLLFLGLRGFL